MISSLQEKRRRILIMARTERDYPGREKAFLAGSHSGMEKKWP